jgi:hypothetical protein
MKKNMSIRTKILTGVVIVNMLGALVTMVYLHQAYVSAVDTSANKSLTSSGATWEALTANAGTEIKLTEGESTGRYLEQMKRITGTEYALLLDKQAVDPSKYATMRAAANLPNNFDEGETYVMVATTQSGRDAEFAFRPTPESVPEIGKLVGVKNGACSKLCHNGVAGEGDYWGVAWSEIPGVSEVHGVYPVTQDGQPVGVLYGIENITNQADAARASMMQTLTVISVTLLVATLFIGGWIDSLVFRRLHRMMVAIQDVSVRVAGGDFDARFEPDMAGDEIGRFEQFFAGILDLMTGSLKSLIAQKKG